MTTKQIHAGSIMQAGLESLRIPDAFKLSGRKANGVSQTDIDWRQL